MMCQNVDMDVGLKATMAAALGIAMAMHRVDLIGACRVLSVYLQQVGTQEIEQRWSADNAATEKGGAS